MNKIISININGIIFHVDETAYERLRKYMDALKAHFRNTEGREEIIGDIEARIAEMLQEQLKGKREVVFNEDIEAVIAAMGMPEDMAETAGEQQQEYREESYAYTTNNDKRVYRDTDDKVLGGVCSGIAAYFDIDPLWLRLGFAIAFFTFGTGFLIYIILWIILPPARTASEKLRMRGQAVNISNIEKTVRDDMGGKKKSAELRNEPIAYRNDASNFFSQLLDGLVNLLKGVFKVLGKVIGFFFIFISVIVLFALITSLLGLGNSIHFHMPFFIHDLVSEVSDLPLGLVGAALAVGIPFLLMFYLGLRLLFDIRSSNKWIGVGMLTAWIAGIIMLGSFWLQASAKFSEEETVTEDLPLNEQHDTLYLSVDRPHIKHRFSMRKRHIHWGNFDSTGNFDMDMVRLGIEPSNDSNFHLTKTVSSRGSSRQEAQKLAQSVVYSYKQEGANILFKSYYMLPDKVKWRAQEVDLILYVPEGKVVSLEKGMEEIIFDIDNVTDTYDGDMVGRKWVMTRKGLSCVDCDDDNDLEGSERYDKKLSLIYL